MIKTAAKIFITIGIIITIISIVWFAFLMHYLFGMLVLGVFTFSVGMFIKDYYD